MIYVSKWKIFWVLYINEIFGLNDGYKWGNGENLFKYYTVLHFGCFMLL